MPRACLCPVFETSLDIIAKKRVRLEIGKGSDLDIHVACIIGCYLGCEKPYVRATSVHLSVCDLASVSRPSV